MKNPVFDAVARTPDATLQCMNRAKLGVEGSKLSKISELKLKPA
jgi:hypothetical protein